MKTCRKCKIEKEVTEFSKCKNTKDGLKSQCRFCDKQYNETNKERISEQKKQYYLANKERINEQNKEYYKNNKERSKEYYKNNKERSKEYYLANKERIKEYIENNKERRKEQRKEYYKNNKERLKAIHKEYDKNNKERRKQYKKEYTRERRKVDPLFKMSCNLRTRTFQAFKNKGYSKNTKTQEMLGVNWEVCKAHIERQFIKGMKWSNHGEWHIDHIIPLASANTEEGLKKLCHYSNLQPLWADDNLIKSDKLIGQQNKLRL